MTPNTPAQALQISPECLEVANNYLLSGSIKETAQALDLPLAQVQQYLDRPEVARYIDKIFFDSGFNNRYKVREAMDAILRQKFQELQESGTGSGKDIADLLHLSHKISMDLLDRELELEKLRQKTTLDNLKTQVNVQINDSGTKYSELINRLLGTGRAGSE
jgi:hypothetical protein